MCDYSLHGVAARPAKVGDKLVTTDFRNTTTRGFSAVGDRLPKAKNRQIRTARLSCSSALSFSSPMRWKTERPSAIE
jgi:hypothetical protein